MEGTLHAFALMAVIFGSAALCYRYGKRPDVVAPAFVFTLVGVLILCSIHPVSIFHGKPPWDNRLGMLLFTHQWPILACCLGLILVFLAPSRQIRALNTAVFLFLGTVFTLHAAHLYTLPEYDIRVPEEISAAASVPVRTPCWHAALTGFEDKRQAFPRQNAFILQKSPPPDEIYTSDEWHGHLQGIGVLFIIMLSVAVLIGLRKQLALRQWRWRVFYALAIFLIVIGMLSPSFPQLWEAPWFIPQFIVPAICIGLVGAFSTASRKVLLPFVAVIYLLGAMLCLHLKWYDQKAHIGIDDDRKYSGWHYGSIDHYMDNLRMHAGVEGNPVISAGWLEEGARWKDLKNPPRLHKSGDYDVYTFKRLQPAWHTPLTQLYRITDEKIAVWYPGGPLEEGLKRLEWRRYP